MQKFVKLTVILFITISIVYGANANQNLNKTWIPFNSNIPQPAEIEVFEEGMNSVLIDMTLAGMNVQNITAGGKNYQLISIPQSNWSDEVGKPKLPIIRAIIRIPTDSAVDVSIEEEKQVNYDNYNIYPVGRKVVRNSRGGTVYIDEEFTIDDKFYSSDSYYPGNLVQISFSGYLREERIVQIEFHPIRYNPAIGKLISHSFIRAKLTYKSKTKPGSAQKIDFGESMAPFAYSTSLTREGVVTIPENLMSDNKADYIIIAPEIFYNTTKLKELAEWRAKYSGLDVAVVSAERLYYSFGSGSKSDETIKSFVSYVYNYWRSNNSNDGRVRYILLIGDVELVPTHISDLQSFGEAIATDNWYVCVQGDDLMPDLMIGRLPAKTLSELNIMIDKIIAYEKNPLYGDWANNALLMLGTVESLKEDLEYARDNYLIPSGFNIKEISALDGGNSYNVIAELNKGKYIVDYAGHGFVSNWEIFSAEDIPKLKNDRMLPVIFSLACSTSYFDNSEKDSLAEAFVKSRNGAIAFFGSSRLAAISEVGFSLSESIANSHIYNLGEITIHTKLKLLPYSTNMELYNLMGDPALDVGAPRKQSGVPDIIISSVDISYEPENPKQGEQVYININVNNFGMGDANDVIVEIRDGVTKGSIIETRTMSLIPAESNSILRVPWTLPLGIPQHDIYVKAYLNNTSKEYYRENNDASKKLFVSLESSGWPQKVQDSSLSSPVIADINSDGISEIIIQSINYDRQNRVYVWDNNGKLLSGWPKTIYRMGFDNEGIYIEPSAGPAPSVGDIDGDGMADIVVVSFSQEVYAWRNDGTNLPGWPVRVSNIVTSTPILADLDSDGKLEVIFGTSNGQMHIKRYDGTDFPNWPKSVGNRGHLLPIVIDIDGDSDLEIIASDSLIPKYYNSNRMSTIYAWHHDGSVVTGWPVKMQGAKTTLPPVAGDLNGNGFAEIVAVSTYNDICKIYVWNHDGTLSSSWQINSDDEIRTALALSDIDRDGDVEIIATSYDKAYAWHHNGNPVYGWPIDVSEGYWFSTPITGDVDGDNNLDIIFTAQGGVIHAYKKDGSPINGWPALANKKTSSSPPLIGDTDGDGKNELIFADSMGEVHKLSLIGKFNNESGKAWNMFQHDQMHTGSHNASTILPLPPSNVTAYDTPDDKGGSIDISWELSPDDDRAKGYVIYRADKPNGNYSMIGKVSQGVAKFTDTSAKIGVTYWYVVRTTDGNYLSDNPIPVSAFSFNNFAPEYPSIVYTNKAKMDGVIDVWWSEVNNGNIAGYKIYIGTSSGVYGDPIIVGKVNHHSITGLINNKEYYIAVSSYDIDGNESLLSKEIVAVPLDEDTEPPVFSNFYPKEVVAGTDFYIKCQISDLSGIYDDDTGSDGQGVYLIWDVDELTPDSHIVRMRETSNGIYVTNSKIPGQPLGTKIFYQVFAYDNDYDWERKDDRKQGFSEKQVINTITAPSIAYNYPNPAPAGEYTDRTIFRYYVPAIAQVKISIYDIAGNLVDKLESVSKGGDYDETEWNISNVASGVYIYTIEINPYSGENQVIKKKLAIVK